MMNEDYFKHSSLLRVGNPELNNQKLRPSQKNLQINENNQLKNTRHHNKFVSKNASQKHSYEERPPNVDSELTE
jgi:hypothetical protein